MRTLLIIVIFFLLLGLFAWAKHEKADTIKTDRCTSAGGVPLVIRCRGIIKHSLCLNPELLIHVEETKL